MTQVQRVEDYIRRNGSITAQQAMNDLGVFRLASRITDLKKIHKDDGVIFCREMVSGINRYGEKTSYARYYIREIEK